MNKKILTLILGTLIVLEIAAFSFSKIYLNKLKREVPKSEPMFALMVEQTKGEGDYQESSDDAWPGSGYKFNAEHSYCHAENEDEIIPNAIKFVGGQAIVKTDQVAYCYLYFDIKTSTEMKFVLGSESNPKYTNTSSIKAYLKWDNDEVTQYCIANTNNANTCTWNNLTTQMKNDMKATIDLQLSTLNGSQTYYLFLKAGSELVEEYTYDDIILDTQSPSCSLSVSGNNVYLTASDNFELATPASQNLGVLTTTTYSGSASDAAGNNCSTSKAVYTYYPATTTYDMYAKVCYENGFYGTNWVYSLRQSNVSESACYGKTIEYYKAEGASCNSYLSSCSYGNPTLGCACYGSQGEHNSSCYVCVQSSSSAYCALPGGVQIPGTNYCW